MMGDRRSPDIAVGPRCHVQEAEQRFGKRGLEDIKAYIFSPQPAQPPSDDGFDVEEENEGSEDESEDENEEATTDTATTSSTSDTSADNEDDGQGLVEVGAGHHRVPRAARVRSNLTVLSQHYNLYFAAYQNKVYVYQPQKPPQILPQVSLILRPPRSQVARLTGGVLDRAFPHQMNYITVGDLGDLEILLLAFDDGDIVAYYTHLIAQAIEERDSARDRKASRPVLNPFFHESVGSSAWGLAIHTHSRLIAASSNHHDVTVFAFGLAHGEQTEGQKADHASPSIWMGQRVVDLEKHFRSRTRTWRVVLPIGYDGRNNPDNIPSIAFCDDSRGNAERVAAIDIKGNTWLLDIWNIGNPAVLIKPTRNMLGNRGRYVGWSILLLPNSSFKPAVSNYAAMGLPANEILGLNSSTGDGIKNDVWLDISGSLHHVKDNAADPKAYQLQRQPSHLSHFIFQGIGFDAMPFVDTPIPSDDEDPYHPAFELLSPTQSPVPTGKHRAVCADIKVDLIDLGEEAEMGLELGMTLVPGRSEARGVAGQVSQQSTTWQLMDFFKESNVREAETKVVEMRRVRLPAQFCSDFSILRATDTSIELQSLDPKAASVLCRDILLHHNYHNRRATPWDLAPVYSERITMYLHVPELGLVVLGSLNGRIALLSLTKPPRRHGFGSLRSGMSGDGIRIKRAFRVEALLPRKQDENKGLRPWCTLHGIAISPVPDHRARGMALHADGWRPKAWRLILHYLDHTILMYDISRHGEDGDLMII